MLLVFSATENVVADIFQVNLEKYNIQATGLAFIEKVEWGYGSVR